MAEVFGEKHETLSDTYIDSLIGRELLGHCSVH